ncbi:biotin transporter BioY [Alicyclobacillus shizuokensis]|uniref:biotin transporter BioY n=1 Tax=Alicyclobacillus shizuokensis TaxID=392014 RepID=UPI00082A82B4|nr:biotin transporter BioY [Alicyclobacillus shizuokensis]MCL6627133.1 biotin transporter BioY [Alicyclobacillus shizuokensis]
MQFRLTVRGVVFSALFAALLVVMSYASIHIPGSPVPITLENMAVMLAGAILGPWYGFFSMLLVLVLTALGLPMLHNSGGMGVILGPTGGYIWMWPVCAFVIGALAQAQSGGRGSGAWRGVVSLVGLFVVVEVCGSWLDYVLAIPWLMHTLHLTFGKAMVAGCYPYLPGDALKAAATAVIARAVYTVYPPQRLTIGAASQVVSLEAGDA